MTLKYGLISFVGGILFSLGALAKTQHLPNPPTPEDAMRCFLAPSNDKFVIEEVQNQDPLILAGKSVCPLVIQAIEDREMKLRRYAILALGNLRCESGLPTLLKIFQDETEKDYFRGDALEAIWNIQQDQGKMFANMVKDRNDHLKIVSDIILHKGGAHYIIRTYESALRDVTQSRCLVEHGKCNCMEECASMLNCHMRKNKKSKLRN